jgi:hypothetical protein
MKMVSEMAEKLMPLYGYNVDENGYPSGTLNKMMVFRKPTKKHQHEWRAACDKNHDEIFGFCQLCGEIRK